MVIAVGFTLNYRLGGAHLLLDERQHPVLCPFAATNLRLHAGAKQRGFLQCGYVWENATHPPAFEYGSGYTALSPCFPWTS